MYNYVTSADTQTRNYYLQAKQMFVQKVNLAPAPTLATASLSLMVQLNNLVTFFFAYSIMLWDSSLHFSLNRILYLMWFFCDFSLI